MSKYIDVLNFLRKFKSQEEALVQNHVPLLLFPKLMDLGCSFLTSAGLLHHDPLVQNELFGVNNLKDKVVSEVMQNVYKHNNLDFKKAFDSLDNMTLYCNGMYRNFIMDFSNNFGNGYHLSNAFDGSIESLHNDEKNALFSYFERLGFTLIFDSFRFLSENFPENEEFHFVMRKYAHDLAEAIIREKNQIVLG